MVSNFIKYILYPRSIKHKSSPLIPFEKFYYKSDLHSFLHPSPPLEALTPYVLTPDPDTLFSPRQVIITPKFLKYECLRIFPL